VEQAIRGVLVFEVAGDFGAEESPSDRMVGVAAETAAAALCVDVDQEGTGVGAIEGADGMEDASHVIRLSNG
jgi:hypothetical protein